MDQPKGCSKLPDGSVWARVGVRVTPSRVMPGCCRQWIWENSHNAQVRNCCERTPLLRTDFRDALRLSDSLRSKSRGNLGSDASAMPLVLRGDG